MNAYEHLFSPLVIRGKVIKNRLVSSPQNGPGLYEAGEKGLSNLTETAVAYFGNIARGGAGIVNTEHLGVDPRYYLGSNWERFNFFSDDTIHLHQLAIMHQLTDMIHAYGALASIELNHPGHYGAPVGDDPMLGPVDTTVTDEQGHTFPVKGMDEAEMNYVSDLFANAAYIGKRGGFDIVNIHAAHNWLLGEFLSPIENTRTDEYGGSPENRARFPKMVLDRIREKVGDDMIIEIRYSAYEGLEGGITMEDAKRTIRVLQETADIVQCSAGMIHDDFTEGHTFTTQYMVHGWNAPLAKEIKKDTDVFIETVGGINDPAMADRFIAEGYADLVAMARSWVADPEWGIKAKSGHPEDIRPCIRCLRCLDNSYYPQTGTTVCTVNPRRVIPHPLPPVTSGTHKKVAVIGGGPAGMQAAVEIAKNGHQVILFEKSNKLGGRLEFADYIEFKSDMKRYREYLETQVSKADNIEVRLNTEACRSVIEAEHPDAIIVAAGAHNHFPPVEGADLPNVMHSSELFGREDELGEKVVMIGGGPVGCEETIYLQSMGKKVDVVEMAPKLMPGDTDSRRERFWTIFYMTHKYDRRKRDLENAEEIDTVKIHLNSSCSKITEKGVYIKDETGAETFIEADSVVLATGLRSDMKDFEEYAGLAEDVIVIGDCKKPGNVMGTSSTGYYASLQI